MFVHYGFLFSFFNSRANQEIIFKNIEERQQLVSGGLVFVGFFHPGSFLNGNSY